MSRDANNAAKNAYKDAKEVYGTSTGRANSLYDQLNPIYSNEAYNPQGFKPVDLAGMETMVNQNAGGAAAGAVGQGNLEAARTGNEGGFNTSLDDSVRKSLSNSKEGLLKVKGANADLKERQRQAGIEGLNSLYDTQNRDVLASIGLQNDSANAMSNASKSGWFQNMLSLMGALKPSASGSVGGWNVGIG